MKPPPFDYRRATTVDEAVALLGQHAPDAKILAGGQSLLPLMKLRLARPAVLVDLGGVRDLAYVRHENGRVAFGAMARLSQLESDRVRTLCPMLSRAAEDIAHPPIRHRGTVCGSLAHADPSAELPAVAVALDAELGVTGPAGTRRIPADRFFVTYLTTSLEPTELLTEVRFPVPGPNTTWGFTELARRRGDFAIVLAAVVLEVGPNRAIADARIALGAVADRAIRCREAEATLLGQVGEPAAFEAAAARAAAPLDPPADVHGSGAYRRHLAEVLVKRALVQAWARTEPMPNPG
ncbi:MAG: FAD binding domain-containing protein [Candidatus Methylomirabilia bacterium]